MAATNNGINNSADNDLYINSLSNDGACETFDMRKSRAGGVITSGDALGAIFFSGYDGSNYIPGAKILSTSSGTIGAGRVASNLVFLTHPDSASVALTRMTIAPTGAITVPAPDSGNTLTLSALGNGVVLSSTTGVISSSDPGAANNVLVSNGVGVAPTWGPVPATAGVTSLTGTANQITVSAPTGAVTLSLPVTVIAPGTLASTTTLAAGNLTTAGVVQNSVTTGILTSYQATNHGLQVGNSSGQLASLAVGATGEVLVGSTGADPSFSALSGIAVTSITGTANQVTASASTGAVTLSTPSTFIAPGTIKSTTSLAAGNLTTAGVVQNSVTTGILTSYAATNHGVQIGNSSGQLASIAVGTTGQVLIGATGADPAFGAASGVSVTSVNGTANQITSSNSGVGSTTLSIPSTFIAPGTIAATTTSTAGTNLISTAGNLVLANTSSSTVGSIRIGSFQAFHVFGTENTFVGQNSGNYTLTAVNNVGVGNGTLASITNQAGNTAVGSEAGNLITSGSNNTTVSRYGLLNLLTGNRNTAIGVQSGGGIHGAGKNYTGAESDNILFNNDGVLGESNKIRIGNATDQNAAFIYGTYNTAVGATAGVALIDSSHQIGGLAGASGTVLVGGTKPAFTALNTLAVTAIAGTANQITASASVGSVTLSTPSTFIAPGSIEATSTCKADTFFLLPTTSSTVGQLRINNVPFLHSFGTDNVLLGANAGNTSGTFTQCTAVGFNAGNALAAGANATYVGANAGLVDAGADPNNGNTGIGSSALVGYTGSTGARNTAVGYHSLAAITTGQRNIAVGWGAGDGITGTDSDNIYIGYNANGSAGNNNLLRIGGGTGTGNGQQNKTFISGIRGITTAQNDAVAVLVDSANQLGTVSSSIRYKDKIQDMGEASSGIMKLRPVSFIYKESPQWNRTGLIAEEVLEVMPELVANNADGLPESVKYHELPALLLNEIQKLLKRIEVLEQR